MNKLTQKALALAESPFIRQARVLAIRVWEPDTVREVDLHLPDCDMSKWNSTQHIKFKVGTLAYRDYTPAGWDAATRTCTLILHTAHDGPGSRWGKQLKEGDVISYMGVDSSRQQPVAGRSLVFLGDETTIGHFLALQQLADKNTTIKGAILLEEQHHSQEFNEYFSGWEVASLRKESGKEYKELEHWLDGLSFSAHQDAMFYVAGYSPAVVRLRKLLRRKGFGGHQVKAQGFWA